MLNNNKHKMCAFSAIELLLTLAVISISTLSILVLSNQYLQIDKNRSMALDIKNNAKSLSKQMEPSFAELLTTIKPDQTIILSESFLQYKFDIKLSKDTKLSLGAPCVNIYNKNNHLYGFLYFNSQNDINQIKLSELNLILDNFAYVSKGSIISSSIDELSIEDLKKHFIENNPVKSPWSSEIYTCPPNSNMFIYRLGTLWNKNRVLNKESFISKYENIFESTNIINDNLNIDLNKRLVFKINESCHGVECLESSVNIFSRNNQLIINGSRTSNYLANLKSSSLTPSEVRSYGETCSSSELGKFALASYNNIKLFTKNILVCRYDIICQGFCYLPSQKFEVTYKPNSKQFTCPTGTFITDVEVNLDQLPDYGQHCCGDDPIAHICYGWRRAHDHFWEGYKYYSNSRFIKSYVDGALIDNYASRQNKLQVPISNYPNYNFLNEIRLGKINYGFSCDDSCFCPRPPSYATSWQPIIREITCSNDISNEVTHQN